MARIAVMSDLHLEFNRDVSLDVVNHADLLILAGDIDIESKAVDFAKDLPIPVIQVAGNHEFYGGCHEEVLADLRERGTSNGIHFLENDVVYFNKNEQAFRILGCTLWTDFCLYGPSTQRAAIVAAESRMNDYRKIKNFSSQSSLALHANSVGWLISELSKPFADGQTIVVTHHAPSLSSIDTRLYDHKDLLNASFASDLTKVILQHQPHLWVHGHTHSSRDYNISNTQVVCNPRGYAPHEANPEFDSSLIVYI